VVFNPAVIHFHTYAVLPTLTGILIIAYGIFVLIREHGSRIGRRYVFFTGGVGWYLAGAGISYAVVDPGASLLWDRIAHLGVAVIPFAIYLSASAIVGQTDRRVLINRILAGATVLFLLALPAGDLFIAGNLRRDPLYYPVYGPVGYLFVAYFAVVLLAVIACFFRESSVTTDPLQKRRLRVVSIATAIGFVGGVDFLPAMGIDLFPFGYIPIALFVAIMGYAILRYGLVDLSPAVIAPTILRTMPSGVIVVDRNNVVRLVNETAGELLEISSGLVDHTLESIAETCPAGTGLLGIVDNQRNAEISWNEGEETERTLSVSRAPLIGSGKLRAGTVYVLQDVSEQKRAERDLIHLALHDPLTGLPNRKLFFDRLDQQVLLAERNARTVAVLYIDLDAFKEINDNYGHESGDTVLRVTASRIVGSVRNTDTVARLGGDEFAVILSEISAAHDVSAIVGNVSRAIEQGIPLAETEVSVSASIGVAVWPEDGSTVESLVSTADTRMYEWKKRR